jgi:hypothetical protein
MRWGGGNREAVRRAVSAGFYPVLVNQDEDLIDPVKYRGKE